MAVISQNEEEYAAWVRLLGRTYRDPTHLTDHQKIRQQILNEPVIPAGGEVHADIGLLDDVVCAFTIRQTYNAAAVAGVHVYFLASMWWQAYMDSENVTDAYANFAPTFVAGQLRQRTIPLLVYGQQYRVLVRNLDAANAQGRCQMWIHRRVR